MRAATRWAARLGLTLGAVLLGLVLVEAGLRLRYPTLPSLAALEDVELGATTGPRPEDGPGFGGAELCWDQSGFRPRPSAWEGRLGPDVGAPVELWAVGDSVIQGQGVQPAQSYPWLLGERLAAELGRPVELRNVSVNGGHFCQYLRELHGQLSLGQPDLVVVGVFSDDLRDRVFFLLGGSLVAFPAQIEGALGRALAGRSYLANLLWLQWRGRVAAQDEVPPDARALLLFRESFAALQGRLEEQGVPVLTLLLDPAGLSLCAEQPTLEDCAKAAQDGARIAGLLDEAGVPFVDLRGFFVERPDRLLEQERRDLERRGVLPVHPDPRGHADLAEALWPSLRSAADELR